MNGSGKVGVCLDTCHLFASGTDLSGEDSAGLFCGQVADALGGYEHVRLIHLNDSKGILGCRKDRHEQVNEGFIGLEGLRTVAKWGKVHNIPMILETKPPFVPQMLLIKK